MRSVWVVINEGGSEKDIVGVFGTSDDAESFVKNDAEFNTRSMLIENYPVPWTRGQNGAVIQSS